MAVAWQLLKRGLPIRLFVVDSKSAFDKLDTINRALFFSTG